VAFWLGVHAGKPTFAEGMRQIRAFARKAGVPRGQAILVDGQGGPPNKISPQAMVRLLRYVERRPYGRVFLRALPVKGIDGIPPEDAELDPATGHVFAKNGLTGALNELEQLEVQAMALAGYVVAGQRRIAFNVVANHTPIRGPDGQYSEDPEVLAAAFTRFENHEGITSLLYTSQLRD
jgi:serine-type D-Ala-D-Ala carboxypeptidase/endopeptidase (penicillin-binding protein 4)